MRRLVALSVLAAMVACRNSAPAPISLSTSPDTALLGKDIRHLASDSLEGRGTGASGNDSAAVYIARRYQALGLQVAIWPAPAATPGGGARTTADAKAAAR
ncbi:MAG: hypothetical protein U0163_14730 [Gemmatimonadaceae bacterium]